MKHALASRKSRAIRLLWLVELSIVMLAFVGAAELRFRNDPISYSIFLQSGFARVLLVGIFITVAMAAFGLYQVHVRHNRVDFLLRLLLSFVFGGVALLVTYYLIPQAYIGRGVLTLGLGLSLLGVTMLRQVWRRIFRADAFKRRVLVLGAGTNADLVNSRLRRDSDRHSFVVVGFVAMPGQPTVVPQSMLARTDLPMPELARWLRADQILVALDERRGGLPMEDMLACAQRGILVEDLSTFFEREAGSITLSVADPSWLAFSGGFDHSVPRRLSKRFFDLVAASALLMIAWPVMLVVALCVWCESRSLVLYRQTRVGENGRSFELLKFRSMRPDAERDGVARWATTNDDRVTRVGRFIRMTRLDELPQLFNVLHGEMSFVGPRPERPHFVDVLNKEVRYYNVRHSVKPGLTGWAQLRYPYGASVRDAEEKLMFDLFYVKNQGLLFDLMILLQTVEVVLFRRGAR